MGRAVLEKLSETSWKHPFKRTRKQFACWISHREVADDCELYNGTKRRLRISFEDKCGLSDEVAWFTITSGREIYCPVAFQDRFLRKVLKHEETYFIVEVLDHKR